jgi:hypothetical protein
MLHWKKGEIKTHKYIYKSEMNRWRLERYESCGHFVFFDSDENLILPFNCHMYIY